MSSIGPRPRRSHRGPPKREDANNMEWRWVDRRALLLLHDESLVEHGGAGGLRDEGLLESALSRPLNLALYERPQPWLRQAPRGA